MRKSSGAVRTSIKYRMTRRTLIMAINIMHTVTNRRCIQEASVPSHQEIPVAVLNASHTAVITREART